MTASRSALSPIDRETPDADVESDELLKNYLVLLRLVERLHRQLLDVIKAELDRIGQTEVNSVQALLLYNIADAEMSPSELRSRGHYLGSNVSYNLKQLIDKGYILEQRSETDRRSKRVSLTDEGLAVYRAIADLFHRQLGSLEQVVGVDAPMMETTNAVLGRFERYWTDQIRYRL